MEDKKPSRLVGSKVSQIANIFQSMVPTKEADVGLNSGVTLRHNTECSPKAERRRTVAGEEVGKETGTQRECTTQVTVVRTESHVARFNNARALFEKLGSEDSRSVKDKLSATAVSSKLSSSQGLHTVRSRSNSDNSSAGNSPVRSPHTLSSQHSSRSPSPRERTAPNSNCYHTNGVLAVEGDSVSVVLGANPTVVTRVGSPAQDQLSLITDGGQSNGVGPSCASVLTQKPEKPEKPERKFNSRELIEKQRNWTSHFTKSRTSRYNSDPNKSEVRVSLSCTSRNDGSVAEVSATPATRSASFSATSSMQSSGSTSTTVQPSSLNSLDKQAQAVTFPARPVSECSMNAPDVEKRLREEEAGEVFQDVAHTDKRKKMVSSMQLTLTSASCAAPPPDVHNSFGSDPPSVIGSYASQVAPITNSVLRELESQSSDVCWLPQSKYSENNHDSHETREDCKENISKNNNSSEENFLNKTDEEWLDIKCLVARDQTVSTQSCRDIEEPSKPVLLIASPSEDESPETTEYVAHATDDAYRCIDQLESFVHSGTVLRDGKVSSKNADIVDNVNLKCNYSSKHGSVLRPAEDSLPSSKPEDCVADPAAVATVDQNKQQDCEESLIQTNGITGLNSNNIVEENQTRIVQLPETMTPDEAECLLSTSILEKKMRQEALLSDEEAQEVTRLLSPDDKDPEWLADVMSVTSESTLDYSRSRSDLSVAMEDSITSSNMGSHSGSESALLGSISSLNDQEVKQHDYCPQPGKVVIVENGVHYFEDGHFWMEVPGLPDSGDEDDVDSPVLVKKNTKVTFSTGPIKVYSTFSVNDYDRRNEDVDPVAASAEYELEKRVEKMEVFPVELTKGPEGLGLSIIGMGVGADAGLEKLGIFVKTITQHGAASRDGRIQVNDQIIEVDGKSLVGVTQAYAASVLRNTCGLVKFVIGRERDPHNSEVAQLIKQSLEADREREELRRQMEQPSREDSSPAMPNAGTSPTSTCSLSDTPTDSILEQEPLKSPSMSTDVEALRTLLQELSEMDPAVKDEEFAEKLRQSTLRLRETERSLNAAKKDVVTYQDMLEQSQGQYIALEKKYCKAKKLLREFQQREQDMIHREEFHLQLLQEKDTEYNALVKSLKDRVIQLEQELLETQKKAGLPAVLPYDSSSLRQLTPQLARRHQAVPVKPLLQQLETELSDTEISDISPEDGDKTATVERKMPVKEELDRAVPPHELLDVSASKAKAELATRGGLAGRQLPSGKKTSGGLSSSSSDYGVDESIENSGDEEDNSNRQVYMEYVTQEENTNIEAAGDIMYHTRPTTLAPSHVHSLVSHFTCAQQQQQQQQQLQQQLQQQQLHQHQQQSHSPTTHIHPHIQHQPSPDPWSSRPQPRAAVRMLAGPPASLAEQLKQVLAERERRISAGEHPPRDSPGDPSEINRGVSQTLMEEIRQAVSEANARVKKIPESLSASLGQTPWHPQGPPSPSTSSCGSVSPAMSTADPSPSRPLPTETGDIWTCVQPQDMNKKPSHVWQSSPAADWSKEQVCQWLLAINLEQHIAKFLELQIGGAALLQLESRDFKQLGVTGDDKNRLKRKLKELKIQVEKEKRQLEKERKEKERLQRKAEKLAEKASRRK